MLDIAVFGHFAIDQVERDGNVLPPSLGGTVTFSSLAAARLGAKVGIVSKVGPDFRDDHLLVFARSGIDVSGVKKVKAPTTKYRLQYTGEERNLTLLSRCDPIKPEDVRHLRGKAKAVHLGPIAGEVPLETVKEVAKWSTIVMLDLQGFVRKFDRNGKVSLERNPQLLEIVKRAMIVKSALQEGETVMNVSGFEEVASSFLNMGCKITIVTLGGKGAYISTCEGESLVVPAINPRRITDLTGAGDAYAGSFLAEYLKTKDLRRSAIIASSAVSFKVEGHSTSGFASRADIEKRAREYLEQ
ncbi:MAG: PfkB family carbohydrate kinase [Promethearchaeati archaeon SRVP18_Atabeyarchaeia-1]